MLNLDKSDKELLIKLLEKDNSNKAQKLAARIKKSMTRIKPRSAKAKGRDWEHECCQFISDLTGISYIQSDDNCEIHAREMGLNGVDVILRGKARELFPYDIECKNCNSISLPDWVRQAESNCTDLDNWLLMIKSPVLPMKKIVVMAMSRFAEIVKK